MTSKPIYYWHNTEQPLQKKLMSTNFVKMDCLADGNCQFRSIETALKHAGYKITYNKLRNAVAKYINHLSNQEFAILITNYREEKKNEIFIGDWNPFDIKNKRDFINVIKKDGFHFQGDDITLSILTKVLKTDFIIINDNCNFITNTTNPDNINNRIIILQYTPLNDTGHYQTIGLKLKETPKRSKVQTIFWRGDLPIELQRLVDKNELYKYIIQNICNENDCTIKSIHDIISEIEIQTGETIKQKQRQNLIKMLYTWIDNNNYLKKLKISKENM